MAYPLIIFGAGASYDYSPLAKKGSIAPLTNGIIEEEFLHKGYLEKYKGVGNLLVDIIHQVKSKKRNFEEVLTDIKNKSVNSVEMKKCFVDLEFYLKDLFAHISKPNDSNAKIHQINNYKSIINRINNYSNGEALIATFNYDSLFENSLINNKPKATEDYIKNPIKIIKLHGSHDWIYMRRKNGVFRNPSFENKDGYGICMVRPDLLDEIKNDNEFEPFHTQDLLGSGESNDFNTFPAIAVPIVGKDKYICPKRHIEVLERNLSKVDRVLIIGWKAEDPLLLETLKNRLPRMGYKILIVSGTLEGAKKIANTVQKGLEIPSSYIDYRDGGFSEFIADDISHSFFND